MDPNHLTKTIGYIVEETSENSELHTKNLVTAKFDLEGNPVGDPSEESWGENE